MTDRGEIKFELRKRSNKQSFWSVNYDPQSGTILGIEPGESLESNRLVVSYAKVKEILAGTSNQEDFRVDFDEKIGALDVINVRQHRKIKKKQNWISWLTSTESEDIYSGEIRCIIFDDQWLRIEADRIWSTRAAENVHRAVNFSVYISEDHDPHMFLGNFEVPTISLIEKGYYEIRLYSFMPAHIVDSVLASRVNVRINIPPVAQTLTFSRQRKYFPFTGVVDDYTVVSHPGTGKHITVFVKNHEVWAQSHYQPGSAIDSVPGNLRAGMFAGDPDNFLGWVEFPALMLRQTNPFRLVADWPGQRPPDLLYKSNNIDIGVLQ